jgi:signal peptidase I
MMKMSKKGIALTLLKERIGQGKPYTLGISSNLSMYPLFGKGGMVNIIDVSIEKVRLGEVIVYRLGDDLIAHRCIRIIRSPKNRAILTKGDNSALADQCTVLNDNLLGKVSDFTIGNNLINCENSFWRVLNVILASISLAEAGYSSIVYQFNPAWPVFILRESLIFFGRICREARGILIKLLVFWIEIVIRIK